MQSDEIPQLLLYATKLWPRTFVAPQNEDELAVTQLVWMDALGDIDAEVLRAAMLSWSDHWPPTPMELRGAALDQRALEAGHRGAPGADEAWKEFRTNYRVDDDWSHPAVAAAARSLGCKAYGNSSESDEMAWRAHFIKLYEVAVKRHRTDTSPLPPLLARRAEGPLKELGNAVAEIGKGGGDGPV